MSSGRRILESYMHSHVKERDRRDHVSQAVSRFGVLRVCVCARALSESRPSTITGPCTAASGDYRKTG